MSRGIILLSAGLLVLIFFTVPIGTWMVDDRFIYGDKTYSAYMGWVENDGEYFSVLSTQDMRLTTYQYCSAKMKGYLWERGKWRSK